MSWQDEALFIRLITVVDDYGRCDGCLALLRSDLCPLRLDEVSEQDIGQFLERMVEMDMLRLYAVDERPYLYITNFLKHQKMPGGPRKTTIPRPDGTLEVRGEYQDDIPLSLEEWDKAHNSLEILQRLEENKPFSKRINNSKESLENKINSIPRAHAHKVKTKTKEKTKDKDKEKEKDIAETVAADRVNDMPVVRQPRAPDLLWEALIAVCGWNKDDVTDSMKGAMRKAHKELRLLDKPVTPGELHELGRRHRQRYTFPVTPSSLAKNVAPLRSDDNGSKRRNAGRAVDDIVDDDWEEP